MNWQRWLGRIVLVAYLLVSRVDNAVAQYAVEVVSYEQGTTPALEWPTNDPYNLAVAAIGQPALLTGSEYPNVVSPFSPPHLRDQIVSMGEGGWITLRLSHYAIPQAVGAEIGIFTNAGQADKAWPSGQAQTPVVAFGVKEAEVEVSENGHAWTSLGNILFDLPTNAYTDLTDPYSPTAGNAQADFQQPFTGILNGFDGLPYAADNAPDMLDLFAGSGGGTWLNLSNTGLPQVGYIRFQVAADGDIGTSLNFELDAVSIARSAMGEATVPEPSALLLATLGGVLMSLHRRSPSLRIE